MKAFLHKLKNDRRGVALELAIVLLVVTFALSTLVLATSLLQHSQKTHAENALPRSIVLEQIGEAFCSATAAGIDPSEWMGAYPDYTITVDALVLTVSQRDPETGSDTILLTVELTYADGKYTVAQWRYN